MRKSKINNIFDWDSYNNSKIAYEELPQEASPKEAKAAKKAFEAEEKKLSKYRSSVIGDLKKGVLTLKISKGSGNEMPYHLYLEFFEDGASLVVFGENQKLAKAFKDMAKVSQHKPYISMGMAIYDENEVLQFIPSTQGNKVKPKPVVDSFKKASVKQSSSQFWSDRKLKNTIIGTSTQTDEQTDTLSEDQDEFINNDIDTLIGDETLLSEEVNHEVEGVQSEIYDQFKEFKTKDYLQSGSYRNTEYYTATLRQIKQWALGILEEFQANKTPSLKKGYQAMINEISEFKKTVKKDMARENSNSLNEFSDLKKFKKLYAAALEKYYKAHDTYERSIELAKMRRILTELHQMDEQTKATEAFVQLDNVIKTRLNKAEAAESTLARVTPEVRTQINSLIHSMTTTSEQLKMSLDSNSPNVSRT